MGPRAPKRFHNALDAPIYISIRAPRGPWKALEDPEDLGP